MNRLDSLIKGRGREAVDLRGLDCGLKRGYHI